MIGVVAHVSTNLAKSYKLAPRYKFFAAGAKFNPSKLILIIVNAEIYLIKFIGWSL
jgi:hypothetical protein